LPSIVSTVSWRSTLPSPRASCHLQEVPAKETPAVSPDTISGHVNGLNWERVKFVLFTSEGLLWRECPWFLIMLYPLGRDVHSGQRLG
jgi:hypothetical protein